MELLNLLILALLFFEIASSASLLRQDALVEDDSVDFANAIDGIDYSEVRRILGDIRHESSRRHGSFHDIFKIKSIVDIIRDDGTEASVNKRYLQDMFETDIILNVPQARHILSEIKNDGRKRRQAVPGESTWWKNNTVYYIFGQNDTSWQNSIRLAQQHIESLTCIKYKFAQNDSDLASKDYIEYIRGGGCWSLVGRQGGRQQVSIGYGCESLGIVAHENMHALGLWHEQSRSDRDGYIQIDWDQIYPSTHSNFEKRSSVTSINMDQPYDLGSAMHYGNRAFTTDWSKYTIYTIDKNYQQTIGQRGGMSFKDAKMINMRYCSNVCSTKLNCQKGGYTDPNDCNKCKCPEGYSGTLCDYMNEGSDPGCGGDLTAGIWPGDISSGVLTTQKKCYWRIRSMDTAKYDRIEVNITMLDFPCRDACTSFIEVKYNSGKIPTGARLCCSKPDTVLLSDPGSEIIMIFHTGATLDRANYTGFNCTYRVHDGSAPSVTQCYTQNSNSTAKHTFRWLAIKGLNGRWLVIQDFISDKSPQVVRTTTTTTRSTTLAATTSTPPTTTTEVLTTSTGEVTTQETEGPSATTTKPPSESTTETTEATTTAAGLHGDFKWTKWSNWGVCSHSCGTCGVRRRIRSCFRGLCSGDSEEVERCNLQPCPLPNTQQQRHCTGRIVMPCDLMKQLEFGTVSSKGDAHGFADLTSDVAPRQELFRTAQQSPIVVRSAASHVVAAPLATPESTFLRRNGRYISGEPPIYDIAGLFLLPTANNARLVRRFRRHSRKRRFVGTPSAVNVVPNLHVDGSVYCEKQFLYNCPSASATLTLNMDYKYRSSSPLLGKSGGSRGELC